MSSNSKSLFSYSTLAHAVAGGCGSAVAMTTFYPLDIVRTKQQLDRKKTQIYLELLNIYQNDGLQGLYKGLLPVVQSLYCSNFVYFYSFHALTRILNKEQSLIKNLFLGMIAGSVNVLSTTPLWVVNTRIKMQAKQIKEAKPLTFYEGLLDGLMKIYRNEGIRALWAGTTSSLILVLNPAIQFMVYEALKNHWTENYGNMGSAVIFMIGALAKTVSTIITYPLQLVQTLQRHGKEVTEGLIGTILYIIRLQGPRGLYRGLKAKLLQTVLTTAVMFVSYEKIRHMVLAMMIGNNNHKV